MNVLHFDQVVAALLFVGVRIAGVMSFAPFLSGDTIAPQVKAGFTLALTALLYPAVGIVGVSLGTAGWVRVVATEALIGLLLGLALQFIFEAAQVAGQIVGVQTGFSLVTLLDPQTEADTPVLTIFHQLIALLIFLQLHVEHWLLRGLAASFSYLPPGSAFSNPALGAALLHAAGGIWLVGVEIAAPVLAATLISDVALGFLGKASPQLPVVFVGLSVKTLLGLAVLAGTLTLWPRLFEKRFANALILGEHLLHLAR
jgi:flagellar biosynthesis protein FliR